MNTRPAGGECSYLHSPEGSACGPSYQTAVFHGRGSLSVTAVTVAKICSKSALTDSAVGLTVSGSNTTRGPHCILMGGSAPPMYFAECDGGHGQ